MRVAMIAPGHAPDLGGVETVVTHLGRELARAGVDVEVWTHASPDAAAGVTEVGGVVVRRFPLSTTRPYPASVALWRHVVSSARTFDLVHGHSYHSAAALGLLAAADAPYVFTPHYHGVGHTRLAKVMHAGYRPLGRRLMNGAVAVVAVSRAEADVIVDHFHHVADRVQVVHHGVDAAAVSAVSPYPHEPPTAVVAGRLERYKRVDAVIEAFHRCDAAGQLVLVGDGPDRSRLEQLGAAGSRAGDIRFVGRVSESALHRWLRTARVVVNMSRHEAFGLVAVEGATAGAAVLLSDIPAHAEITGLLSGSAAIVTDRDGQLAEALADRLATPSGPPRPLRTWDEVAADHLRIYEQVAGGRAGARS